jgi:NADH-quinone oxidoreductase subunit L
LRAEAFGIPPILKNLFYFNEIIEVLIVRPSQMLGSAFGRILDPQIIDGAVREVASVARGFGTLVRSLETGLVRAYALILAFGAACFIVYYAIAAGGAH